MSPAVASESEPASALLDRALVMAVLENSPHYIFFKNRESQFVAVSKSLVRYFGRENASEIIGRTDFDFFAPVHANAAFAEEQRIIQTGQPTLGKMEREVWPDGRVSWVLSNKLPLRNDAGEIIGTFGSCRDVTRAREVETALEKTHKDLVDASRMAGMAEVASGVLHNVGNVLSSLNVSASVIGSGLRQSRAESLGKLAAVLHEHQSDLGTFLTEDPKGRRIPELLASLASHAADERQRLTQEILTLQKNIDHIKEIVSMQQTYATLVGVVEPLDPVMLMDDALRINAADLAQQHIAVERAFAFSPPALGEKGKVLQILINLIRNAKWACDESGRSDKKITLRIQEVETAASTAMALGSLAPYGLKFHGRVRFTVEDNGVGIAPDNLTRIFAHGFTTKKNGHGFGLHSSANAAREMKGALTVQSGGLGQGATFILDLPAAPPCVPLS